MKTEKWNSASVDMLCQIILERGENIYEKPLFLSILKDIFPKNRAVYEKAVQAGVPKELLRISQKRNPNQEIRCYCSYLKTRGFSEKELEDIVYTLCPPLHVDSTNVFPLTVLNSISTAHWDLEYHPDCDRQQSTPQRTHFKPIVLTMAITLILTIAVMQYVSNTESDFVNQDITSSQDAFFSPAITSTEPSIQEALVDEVVAPYNLQQVIIETHGSTADLSIQEWADHSWVCLMEVPAYIGTNGATSNKLEGDHATPMGEFNILFAFSSHSLDTKLDTVRVFSDTVWVDDVNSIYYNTLQSNDATYKDWNSSENIYVKFSNRTSWACICFDFNGDCRSANSATYKGGSAVFIDGVTSAGNLTSGYGDIKISDTAMIQLLEILDASKNPVVIIK